ncbi:hypothetical protein D5086_019029 [Populus alba]|uniref:Uncharacterized protein n=1 Tax=Populus alba TaxID=43335 RepID=A0ACC4BGQ1_POPAL
MFSAVFFATLSASLQLSAVSFYFLLVCYNMDPSVFAAAGTTGSPSSPNTNVSAFYPNINAVMLPSAATATVIPLSNTQKMKPYLIGQGVFSFVDGPHSYTFPLDLSTHYTTASANINYCPSQAFLTWKQQDELILNALLSSLSIDFLHDLRQGDDIVTLYLQKTKGLFDELATTDRPISLTNFNLYVFRGLRDEFRDLVTSLSTNVESLGAKEKEEAGEVTLASIITSTLASLTMEIEGAPPGRTPGATTAAKTKRATPVDLAD